MQRVVVRIAAQVICQLVTGNRLYPRRQRLLRLVGMTCVMHGQQHFLQQVFDFGRALLQPPPQKPTHMHRQRRKEFAVGPCIARQPAQQQALQLRLACAEVVLRVSSLHGGPRLHRL